MEWFIETKSDTHFQRRFRKTHQETPLPRPPIRVGTNPLKKTTVFCTKLQGVQWCKVKMPKAYLRSSSAAHISRLELRYELQMPHSTVHRVLGKRFHLYAYKLQVFQIIMPHNRIAHNQFAVTTLENLTRTTNS